MQKVLILDFGSQYTQLIARRIREQNVYCEVRTCLEKCTWKPDALVLSGGPASVLGEDAPPFDTTWLELDIPILGICYGMQLLAHSNGGEVRKSTRREYGQAEIHIQESQGLFQGIEEATEVWMSHGDDVVEIPQDWKVLARSEDGVVAAMASEHKRYYGLQFHPEVTHSLCGEKMIQNFLFSNHLGL